MNYIQKKTAVINDLSGYGRCSLTIQLPLISAFGIQACPIPTGIFSNHTGYPEYYKDDFVSGMRKYINEWKKLDLKFDGICIGYFTSAEQIKDVEYFINNFKNEKCPVILDPVMGDDGRIYQGYSIECIKALKTLVKYSDILTPNLTEACILTDTEYKEEFTDDEIKEMADKLIDLGPSHLVISGIDKGNLIENHVFIKKDKSIRETEIIRQKKSGICRPGTGDIFSAVITANAVKEVDFIKSVRQASEFISKCIKKSDEMNIDNLDGVCFEEFIKIDI